LAYTDKLALDGIALSIGPDVQIGGRKRSSLGQRDLAQWIASVDEEPALGSEGLSDSRQCGRLSFGMAPIECADSKSEREVKGAVQS